MKTFFEIFNRLEEYAMILLLPAMTIIVFGATLVRYFNIGSVPWADEAGRYLMIALVFVGVAYGFRKNAHLGVSFLVDKFPPKLQLVCLLVRSAILLVFAALMLYSTSVLIQIQSGFVQRSAALGLPMYQVYYIMYVGWVMIIVRIVQAAFYDIVRPIIFKNKTDTSENGERSEL